MKNRRYRIWGTALATLIGAICYAESGWSADAPGRTALNAIIDGAKKEGMGFLGKLFGRRRSGRSEQGLSKGVPVVKVEYTRLRPPYERLLVEMQAGNFPYDTMAIRPNLVGQHRQLGFLIDRIDWKTIFGVDPRMIHPEGIAVSVITNPAVIAYNKNLVPKQHIPKSWADCYNPFFRGKLAVLVGASQVATLWGAFGDKWGVDFTKKLLSNNPRWVSGNTNAQNLSPLEKC